MDSVLGVYILYGVYLPYSYSMYIYVHSDPNDSLS